MKLSSSIIWCNERYITHEFERHHRNGCTQQASTPYSSGKNKNDDNDDDDYRNNSENNDHINS
jgi:hypothetical protein